MKMKTTSALLLATLLAGCGSGTKPAETKSATNTETSKVQKQAFGKTGDGTAVDLYTLTNKNGITATITNYGGIITSLKTPDKQGNSADIVLGFDNIDGYLKGHPYFGALIGRYGNRIGKARFLLNGKEYKLAANNGPNHLHGGVQGFDKKVWQAKETTKDGAPALELTYVSKDGEEGYPGTLTTTVTYSLNDQNELRIDYLATTDADTVVNLTNHSYFNLAGAGNGDILKHQIRINASQMTPVDETLITTGELKPVANTPFDFTQPHAIGERINANDTQIKYGKGYDHNFVLNKAPSGLTLAARVTEPTSGRTMEVHTDQPGVQFYTGNFLDGTLTGKGGKVYQNRYGFCLETQHFPDSPNKPSFPSVVLKPGEQMRSTTIYKFGVE
ncbi:MAG: aldose epimerase family protein [Bryobacteraceae bacterium]|nr:aldose epimerase family protein [Bryobacteraceae bacterium]